MCEKHPDVEPVEVCGDETCPRCYLEDLLGDTIVKRKAEYDLVMRHDAGKHRDVLTRVPR